MPASLKMTFARGLAANVALSFRRAQFDKHEALAPTSPFRGPGNGILSLSPFFRHLNYYRADQQFSLIWINGHSPNLFQLSCR